MRRWAAERSLASIKGTSTKCSLRQTPQFVGAEHLYAISRTAVRTNLNFHTASNYLRAQPNFSFPGAPFKDLRRESFKTDKRISHRSVQASLNASRGPLGKSFDSSP